MGDLKGKLAGKFIVIDGPDGSGKSTQLKLLAAHLHEEGLAVEVVLDPGTTKIGKKIRDLLLDRDNGEISPICETLLFMASRAQLVYECIRPALEAGKVVLCDRFISATIAYQGASGVDPTRIIQLGEIAVEGLWPDLTLILDITVEEGTRRIGVVRKRLKKPAQEELQRMGPPKKGEREHERYSQQISLFGDRMEVRSDGYHRKVRQAFKDLDRVYPAKVRHVNAMPSQEEVFRQIIQTIAEELVTSHS